VPAFLVLVVVFSVPFWIAGASGRQLLPGLPVSALMAVCPLLAAAILVQRERGRAGVADLLARSVDPRQIRPRIWLVPILLLVPAITAAAYALMRLTGPPLPAPSVSLPAAAVLFLVFVLFGAAEEAGWTGYATDPLQARLTALGAGLLLGLVWAAWHVGPLLQAQREPSWIAWWSLNTVALRVLIVWIYDNAGRSVATATLVHAVSNLCWQSFPENGSAWDPRVVGSLTAVVAVAAVVVWGPRTPVGVRRS
jgi:membrane protease YdiL (CAAX protease family)